MTQKASETLDGGRYSLAVGKNGRQDVFCTRGIATLLHLVKTDPERLRGALVTDKVVGKAAAALMAVGGVAECRAMLASQDAADLLGRYGIPFSCEQLVPHILNNSRTGLCPMERACAPCRTPDECLRAVEAALVVLRR